jgi:hypothetical protein
VATKNPVSRLETGFVFYRGHYRGKQHSLLLFYSLGRFLTAACLVQFATDCCLSITLSIL